MEQKTKVAQKVFNQKCQKPKDFPSDKKILSSITDRWTRTTKRVKAYDNFVMFKDSA